MKRISVVIPVYNNRAGLRICLDALASQTLPRDDYEVLVIDNGSTEPYADLVEEFPQVTWLQEPKPGSYAARNRGIERASAPVIAFTDSDCIPDAHWLEQALVAIGSADAAILGGRISFQDVPDRPLNIVEICESQIFYMTNHRGTIERSKFAVTANLIAARPLFAKVGIFDESLKSSGDRDWVGRALRAGATLRYAEGAKILHPRRSSFDEIARKIRRLKGGMVAMARKNPSWHQWGYALRYTFLDFRLYKAPFCAPHLRTARDRAALAGTIARIMMVGTRETLRVLVGAEAYRGQD